MFTWSYSMPCVHMQVAGTSRPSFAESMELLETQRKSENDTSANGDETESQASTTAQLSEASEESSGEPEDVGPPSTDSLSSDQESDKADHVLTPVLVRKKKFFKIVGDNIDKDVKPRDMRVDYSTRSLHYFHAFAVQDRLDLTGYSDKPRHPDMSSIELESLLPSPADEEALRSNMSVLVARTLVKHLPFFTKFGAGVKKHILHRFYVEMSQKSTVVSLIHTASKCRCNYILTH